MIALLKGLLPMPEAHALLDSTLRRDKPMVTGVSPSFLLAGEKSYDFSANRFAVGCAHPSGALATEKYFSDVHAAGKMIEIFCAVRGANSAKLFTR